MSSEIYWFSGTGNSLAVAKAIADKTGGKLIPIASVMEQERVTINADVLGIIFPVYYAGLPAIIKAFVAKLEGIRSKYIFAVCTYGGGPGASMKALRQLVSARGGTLSAVFGLHMPQNAFRKPWEVAPKVIAGSTGKLGWITRKVNAKARVDRPCHPFWRPFQFAIYSSLGPALKKGIAAHSGSSPDLDLDELIHRADKAFDMNEGCNGCGTCMKVCPVGNIDRVDGRPVWQHRCENCLACYNFCPQKAITGGIVHAGYYYRHPDVRLSDMLL